MASDRQKAQENIEALQAWGATQTHDDFTQIIFRGQRGKIAKAQYILNPDTGAYHPTTQLLMENVVAKRLNALAQQNDLFDESANTANCAAVAELPYDFIEAVTTCLNNAVSCITGGAGTGETSL